MNEAHWLETNSHYNLIHRSWLHCLCLIVLSVSLSHVVFVVDNDCFNDFPVQYFSYDSWLEPLKTHFLPSLLCVCVLSSQESCLREKRLREEKRIILSFSQKLLINSQKLISIEDSDPFDATHVRTSSSFNQVEGGLICWSKRQTLRLSLIIMSSLNFPLLVVIFLSLLCCFRCRSRSRKKERTNHYVTGIMARDCVIKGFWVNSNSSILSGDSWFDKWDIVVRKQSVWWDWRKKEIRSEVETEDTMWTQSLRERILFNSITECKCFVTNVVTKDVLKDH